MLGVILALGLVFVGCSASGSGGGSGGVVGDDVGDDVDTRPAGLYIGDSSTPVSIEAPFTLAKALTWLESNATENTGYTILLGADDNLAATTLNKAAVKDATGVSITLQGKDQARTIQLTGTGSLFTIHNENNEESAAITLILDQNITLKGVSSNNAALVKVNTGGILEMRSDAKITGNTNSEEFGSGGVYNDGTFTMKGGEISGNTAGDGGGVYNGGTFTMKDGKISGNNAGGENGGDGGGVYNDGTFTMEGGVISGNNADDGGGGVSNSGTFTIEDGVISGNIASGEEEEEDGGGGVFNSGTFTMKDGEISGNNASGSGGGVFNDTDTFTMEGGEISGNTAGGSGGGVENFYAEFTMEDGVISGNTASGGDGGGVFNSGGSFTKTGGTIYGDTDTTHTPDSTENTATSGNGHAVFSYVTDLEEITKKRNSTAGPEVNLDNLTDTNWD
jgi:hypothetical protein